MAPKISGTVMSQIIKAYTYVGIWMSVSIAVIMFNKWLLAYSGFPFPISLTLWHMFFCSSVAVIFVKVLRIVPSLNMSMQDYYRRVMPIGLLYAASLWLSNASYLYLSVSFIQMTKSLMPGLVYASGVFLGNEVYESKVALNMTLIAFGVVVCAMGEMNLVVKGLVMQLLALVFEAVRLAMVQILMNSKGIKMNPIQSLYYVSPACFICLFIPWLFVELPRLQVETDWTFKPDAMLLNASTAFLLNLAVFLLIGKTSALTMNIAGVIKDWMLIFFSFSLFKAPVTRLNLFGYFFCCTGVGIYNWHKLQALQKADKGAGKKPAPGDAEAKEKDEDRGISSSTRGRELENMRGQIRLGNGTTSTTTYAGTGAEDDEGALKGELERLKQQMLDVEARLHSRLRK